MSGEMHEADPMRYLLGELDDDERVSFEGRMRQDDELRARVADAEELIVAMRALPGDAWPPAPSPPADPVERHG